MSPQKILWKMKRVICPVKTFYNVQPQSSPENGIFILTSGSGSANNHGQTFGLGSVSLLKSKNWIWFGSKFSKGGSDFDFLLFFTLEQFTASG